MAPINKVFLTLFLNLIFLSSTSTLAQLLPVQHECNIQQLSAAEPTWRLRAEAGVVEVWEPNHDQFRCAGVAAIRHLIEPNGLLLPSFTNAPYVTYVVQGRGVQGVIVPGCPETYRAGGGSGDEYPRVFQVREGDVIGSPSGVVQWTYNDGNTPIVSVTLLDLSNSHNQLDRNFRSFYLAGQPQSHIGPREVGAGGNIYNGFEEEFLADIFNVESQTIRKVKGEGDERGSIIRVEGGLEGLIPKTMRSSSVDEYDHNGVEQTFCSLSFSHNIDKPSSSDLVNPSGARMYHLNGYKLPLLKFLQLTVERVVLYKNATLVPYWNLNAHSVMYITKGSGQIQVAGDNRRLVFDGRVEEGQMLVVPQNFVVVKKAEEQGLEWVAFKTNDNAMISPLGGAWSAFRAMPIDVLMNSYGLSRDEVRRIKFSREEE